MPPEILPIRAPAPHLRGRKNQPIHPMHLISLSSPVGPLLLEHDGSAVTSLRFCRAGHASTQQADDAAPPPDRLARRVAEQLGEYFSSARTEFDLPLRMAGTDFQKMVWAALGRIPPGETRTYGELAREVGCSGGARAVGQANARNPIPIIIPCHRVVGAAGRIGGYSGDWGGGEGIERKRWLLAHEAVGSAIWESCGAAPAPYAR